MKLKRNKRISFTKTLVIFIGFCNLIKPIFSVILDKQVRAVNVEAVEGKVAEFPCDIDSVQHDKVHIVFWFKDDAGLALYSFDVRGTSLSKGKHWSSPTVFGPRAFFRISPSPAALLLKDVKRHDEGVYRCRVDYRNAQTVSFRYNLTVIVPPGAPFVVDRSIGALNSSILGPKEEGDDLLLTCTVQGGRPSPTVRWLVNGVLVDVEYEHSTGDVIENRLSWPAIGRQDYGSIFTCQANNSPLIEAKEASFTLDMNLRPLTVKIEKDDDVLSAGRRYSAKCITTGSRPAALITWHKGRRQLKKTKEESKENITISEVNFVPAIEDDGRSLTCKAENPNLSSFIEASWKLEVIYPPQVSLVLGNTLTATNIKEGDDVYFECHVQSNPPWRKLSWLRNGVLVSHNTSARVVRSNQSLVLQKVTRQSSGRYSCSAINSEGETISDEFILRVKYSPICKYFGSIVIGAARNKQVFVSCEVDADPPARFFKWKFNNSGETADLEAEKYTSNGSLSILRYTPVADLDFGTFSCTAVNDVGIQTTPCIFQLVAAGKPQQLTNCSTLVNSTSGVAEIACEPGFDGGLPQHFLLEIYSSSSSEPVFNISNTEAIFNVALEIDTTFQLKAYAVNAIGRSLPAIFGKIRLGNPEKQEVTKESSSVSLWVGALVGIIMSISLLVIIITYQVRRSHTNRPIPQNDLKSGSQMPLAQIPQAQIVNKFSYKNDQSFNDVTVDDRDPDIIPVNYEPPTLYARTWGSNNRIQENNVHTEIFSSHELSLINRPQMNENPLNVQDFKEKLLDTRLPESCV